MFPRPIKANGGTQFEFKCICKCGCAEQVKTPRLCGRCERLIEDAVLPWQDVPKGSYTDPALD